MASDNVVSFDQMSGGTRRKMADARANEVIAACRARLVDTLPRLLNMTTEEFQACLDAVEVDWENHVKREIQRLTDENRRHRKSKVEEQYRGWNWVVAENVDPAVVKEVSLHPERYRGFSIRSIFRRSNHSGAATRRIVGATSGVYFDRPESALIDALDSLCRNAAGGRDG